MKKFEKNEILNLVQLIFAWIIINLAANLIGLWITKLLNEAEYTFPENIFNEFTKPILIQSVLFAICLSVGFAFMTKKKFAPYVFTAFQVVVFHILFFMNLGTYKGHSGLYFISAFDDFGLKYLTYSGQYLIDILYLYFPINGKFENGLFLPTNLGAFYIHWILLDLLYYFGITWIAVKVAKFLFNVTPEIKAKIDTTETPESNETKTIEPVE